MALLRNARVEDDDWIFVADDQPIPAEGAVVVPLARYQAERDRLNDRSGPLGLVLAAGETPRAIADDVARFELICLDFPKFTDGRAYSAARLLRERFDFQGELRAIGNVLRDQLAFMWRCGFDAFEIPDSVNALKWITAVNEISVHMQPAADGPPDGGDRRGLRDFGAFPGAYQARPAGNTELWAR